MIRRGGLIAVVLGAMVLGVHGQVAAVQPLLGTALGAVLAVTADVATLLALHEALSSKAPSVRRWAWAVMLLAGGQSIGLNVWYAVASGKLPVAVSVAIGGGPVVLAGLLSHLLALSLAAESHQPPAQPSGTGTPTVPASRPAGPSTGRDTSPRDTSGTRDAPGRDTRDAVARDVPAPVPVTRPRATGTSAGTVTPIRRALPAGTDTDDRAGRMRAYVLTAWASGRDVTGGELDREFDTKDYGRRILRQLREEHPDKIPAAPAQAEGGAQ